jgi:hypothetical protein
MATEPSHKTPPYASYTSFQNYLEHLKGAPLPSRIDKSVMSHLNYGTQQALMAALKSLALIDDNGAPTARLSSLVSASKEERSQILLEAAQDAYPYFWNGSIDLSKTTPGEFHELIRASTGAQGTTVEKVSAFFFGLAGEAGVELSPHLTSRKPAAAGNGKRSRSKAKKAKASGAEADDKNEENEAQKGKPGSMAARLLEKFPDLNPEWDPALQKKWFSAFEKLMESAEKAGKL